MSFCWVTINVKDLEKSIQFYKDFAGLEIKREMSPVPGIEIIFLGSDETGVEVELISNEKNKPPSHGNDISLGFNVESLDKTIEMLRNSGISTIEGPFEPSPFIKFIFVKDPDGVRIQFVENMNQ